MSTALTPRSRFRRPPEHHTSASSYVVVSTRGRHGLVLVVNRCPFCDCAHVHRAITGFVFGERLAAYRRGRYVVHAVIGEEAA